MYDLVGGGFHRYSVDERWLVPHFEKMLYDNALLVPAYLHALAADGACALPRDRRGDGRVHAPRAARCPRAPSPPRRTRTPTASRGSRTRGRRTRSARTWPRCCEPFEHGRSIIRGELSPEARARLLAIRAGAAAAGARRQGDRVLERSRARRARRGGPPARPRRLARRRPRARRLPARAALLRTGASTAATAPAARAAPATSTTTRTSRTGSTSSTSRPATSASWRSRDGWRCSRSSSSPTTSAAASS